VRSPVVLLLLALAGMLGGGALVGVWCLGVCLIVDSLAVAAWGLLTLELPERGSRPAPSGPVFLDEYLQRKAAENW
jgi:hypothetical protein